MEKHYIAKGKVRSVMFRQTLIRGAQKRGLQAGASNVRNQYDTVRFTLHEDEDQMNDLLKWLTSGKPINSWGALIRLIEADPQTDTIAQYEVTTENVDSFRWNPNIEMYLD